MKWLLVAVTCALLCTVHAEEQEDGENRLGYITISDTGTTLNFNATSIQNAVLLGLALVLVGALILPLLGLDLFGGNDHYDSYGHESYSEYGHETPYDPYSDVHKRSAELVHPVLGALNTAYKKYEDQ